MGTTTTISLDRFRRRAAASAPTAGALAPAAAHPLVGTAVGAIERRYGLMSSEEIIRITDVVATSGDLAVADRLAFVAALERHEAIAVIEFDGWYVACATERTLRAEDLHALRVDADMPRIMSLATQRGITPALGPLVA